MTIKEVEKSVEISVANIRYYEKEGLLTPKRSLQNNYRDYSTEDIEILKKIKMLRILGISIADIKSIITGDKELPTVIKERITHLQSEKKELDELESICQNILIANLHYDNLTSEYFDYNSSHIKQRIRKLIQEDTIQKYWNRKQANQFVAKRLVFSYFLSVLGLLLLRSTVQTFTHNTLGSTLVVMYGIGLVASFLIYEGVSRRIVLEIIYYFISIFEGMAICYILAKWDMRDVIIGIYLILMLFVATIWISTLVKNNILEHQLFVFGLPVIYVSSICGIFYTQAHPLTKISLITIGCIFVLLEIIIINWRNMCAQESQYNQYYMYRGICKLVNIFVTTFATYGYYGAGNWNRGNRPS